MPNYRYQGRNLEGKAISGDIDAPTEELAADALINRGIIPTSIAVGG